MFQQGFNFLEFFFLIKHLYNQMQGKGDEQHIAKKKKKMSILQCVCVLFFH